MLYQLDGSKTQLDKATAQNSPISICLPVTMGPKEATFIKKGRIGHDPGPGDCDKDDEHADT